MIGRLAALRYLRLLAALMCLTVLPPIALAAQDEPDTVVVHAVNAGQPLLKLMTQVASLAKGAFMPAEAEAIQKQAWEASSSMPEIVDRQLERSYAYLVQGRSQRRAVLAIRLLSTYPYSYDVRIEGADDALMKAIRVKLGELGFDSLVPIDRTRLTLEEGRVPGKPPRLVLALQTVREFSCLGYYIDHDMRLGQATAWVAPDTVLLNLHGVASRGEMCPSMIGPATMFRELSLRPGKYVLVVRHRGRRDRLLLDLSDSATSVTGLDSSLVKADERPRWRHPPNSFVFRCGVMKRARALCADAKAWVARQPGIFRLSFSPGAINPYNPRPAGPPDDGIGFFRYDRVPSYEALRPCFDGIDTAIRDAVGVSVTVEDWRGVTITAYSRRSFHERHVEVPARVSGTPACPALGPR